MSDLGRLSVVVRPELYTDHQVEPSCQRRGVGRQLIEAGLRDLRAEFVAVERREGFSRKAGANEADEPLSAL